MTVRLWSSVTPSGGALGSGTLNLADEIEVSSQQGIYAIWWWSAPGAAILPSATSVWNLDTSTAVLTDSAPSWSGAAGSGWVSAAYDGMTALNPGTHYAVACFASSASVWRYHTAGYWTTGTGASGISNGVLSAPSSASSKNGQSCAASGSNTVPTGSGAGQNFWVDIEVGGLLVTVPGTATAAEVSGLASPSLASAAAGTSRSLSGSAALARAASGASASSFSSGSAALRQAA